jgi:cytoskeleton protein RodZ
MSNFGASFRKAREAAGLPLEKIAVDTRITTRFLLAIESEEFHLLPGGIFNRGFIRAYAERLGMDPDRAVADYDSLCAGVEEPLEVLRNAERASTRRTERNFYPLAAAILVLLIGGYYVANRHFSSISSVTQRTAAAQPASAPVAQAAAVQEEVAPKLDAVPAQPPVPVPAVTPTVVSTTGPGISAYPPPPVPIRVEETNRAPLAAAIPPVPVTSATPTATAITGSPAASVLVLDVDIKDVTWIRVSADGAVVLADNLQAGATRRFSAERSLDITIGNAAGVSLKINGRDLGQLGTNGRVREIRITPENAGRIQG